MSENYQKETGKQCLCIYKTILASNVFVPTNTKKHLNRRLRNGCFFLACWSSAPIPGEHKVFWVTLLDAVATQNEHMLSLFQFEIDKEKVRFIGHLKCIMVSEKIVGAVKCCSISTCLI